MKKILLFRHESWIEAPHLTGLLLELGIPHSLVKIDEGDAVPDGLADDIGGLVFWGGTMSVNDPLTSIEKEIALIRLAERRNIPVMGHCFGSQLISKALGGKVAPMKQKEIGWHPVDFAGSATAADWRGKIPNRLKILIWHHDEFIVPEGAFPLYSSESCKNQAFAKGNILATVAHIELSAPMLLRWLDIYGHDIEPNGKSVQSIAQIKDGIEERMREMHVLTDTFYQKWLRLAYPPDAAPLVHEKLQSYLKTGSCLCGDVSFFMKHPREVVNCHCGECRRFHGNYAAYTKARLEDIYIVNAEKIGWYQPEKNRAKRGHCRTCGSSLFWQQAGEDGICVAAGALDMPAGLQATKNIYVDDAGDFYKLDGSLENYAATMKNAPPME